MRALTSLLVLSAIATFGASALADGPGAATQTEPGKFTMPDTVIVGHPPRPSVVVEIARVQPWVAVRDLSRTSNTGGVEDATRKKPF